MTTLEELSKKDGCYFLNKLTADELEACISAEKEVAAESQRIIEACERRLDELRLAS